LVGIGCSYFVFLSLFPPTVYKFIDSVSFFPLQ
jgi:hypothetical protein